MASDYYTAQPEMRATVDVAAAMGSYGAGGVQAQESMVVSPETPAVEESMAVEGHKTLSHHRKYSEEELEEFLSEWVTNPDCILPINIHPIDLYTKSSFEDLAIFAENGVAYFVLNLAILPNGNINRTMGDKSNHRHWLGSTTYEIKKSYKRIFKYHDASGYNRKYQMLELTLKNGPRDRVLCKISGLPEMESDVMEAEKASECEYMVDEEHAKEVELKIVEDERDDELNIMSAEEELAAALQKLKITDEKYEKQEETKEYLKEELAIATGKLKGKSEQMMEYIKKLRACIKCLLEREGANLAEIGKLSGLLEAAEKQYSEIVAQLKNAIEESKAKNEELQKQYASLQEILKKNYIEMRDTLRSLGEEKEASAAVESLRNEILEDRKKAKLEEKRLNDQIKMLQDTNKRLQEYNTSLQQYNCNLQADATKNAETISKLQKEKNTMVETMNGLRDHANSVKMQLDLAKSLQNEAAKQKNDLLKEVEDLRSELQHVLEDHDNRSAQVDSLLTELGTYKEMTGKSAMELDSAMTRTTALEEFCSSQRETIKTLEIKLAAANEKLKRSDLTAMETMTEYENQKRMLADLQSHLEEAEQQILDGEKLRKKLHNTILELKGNIRVFCRVRPLLSNESGAVTYPKGGENLGHGMELMHNAQAYSFTFDKVFDHLASQEDVFIEISQLVQSALDGYKVCIFAYGQTGSGKTYTMMGNPKLDDQKGMIPRSLEQIFQASQVLNSQGWKYKTQASMLEIYNETIRDLLATNRVASQDGGSAKYIIKHDANGNTHVSDLTIVDVTSSSEVSSLLRRAAQSRSVGRTQMNEESSRSHCVFTLRIFGVNEGTDQQVQGVLNLIDLAGSERLNKSGATGDRLKETQAINKSLSCLSNVIFSIAKKDEHVPFRNSKLTYLLQPCLGGDSKTLMFVNLSPELSSTGESICSLRFAARVNSCEIGIPQRQTQLRRKDEIW